MLKSIPFKFPNVKNVTCAFQVRDLPHYSSKTDSNYIGKNISFDVKDNFEDVVQNRLQILHSFNVDSFSDITQVHGITTIYEPESSTPSAYAPYNADGMATSKKNHALCIKTADCQPILITDISGEYLLALHVGWKGNRQNYPYIAVEEFCEHYNIKASNLLAVRGPSLAPNISEFINYSTEWGADFNKWYSEKDKTVNLWELTKNQLQEAGIQPKNIFSIDLCTYSNPLLFYSFRYSNECGRQGSFIWINS